MSHGHDAPPTTCWSYIQLGRNPDGSQYEEAWRYLVGTYRPLVERFFRRAAPDEASALEWTDDFLADWVGGSLDRAAPDRGSFRAYLYRSLDNYRNKRLRRRSERGWVERFFRREKGSSSAGFVPLDVDVDDPSSGSGERAFELDYARRVLELALDKLRRYQDERAATDRRPNHYHSLVRAYYLDAQEGRPTQADLAARFGLTSKAVERQLDGARKKLRAWIVAELAETVVSPDELEVEIGLFLSHCSEAVEGSLEVDEP